jgi:uncharacterized protein (TIGR02147 family)
MKSEWKFYMRTRLGAALGIAPDQLPQFPINGAEAGAAHSAEYAQLASDTFAIMADWYHYAILELTKIQGFQSDAAWVASTLGISRSEVNIAVERLLRLGLLGMVENGTWKDISPQHGNITSIQPGSTSAAAKLLQRQILNLSLQALEEIPLEERSHTSMTMALDIKDLPIAVEFIKRFRRDLCSQLEQRAQPTHVYQLHIGFYPVSRSKGFIR